MTTATTAPILAIEDLSIVFASGGQQVAANSAISLKLHAGEVLGIVGESGSGKSVLCRAILRLHPEPPRCRTSGRIVYEGRDILAMSDREIRRLRGGSIGMIFQNPMSSLNPVWPIGDQITESLRVHEGLRGRAAREKGIDLLRQVGISSPERRFDEYPHQWSGGMLQRAVIAMAMAGEPRLLLADEPTTALDVTIQDQILALLLDLQRRSGMTMILVSHDMGVVAETCDRVAVMYGGRIVEEGSTADVMRDPRHPYTQALMESIPSLDDRRARLPSIPGHPPSLANLPAGCAFAPRCPVASPDCRESGVVPPTGSADHWARCLHPDRAVKTETPEVMS